MAPGGYFLSVSTKTINERSASAAVPLNVRARAFKHFVQVFHVFDVFVLQLAAVFRESWRDLFAQFVLDLLIEGEFVERVAHRRRRGFETSGEENKCLRGYQAVGQFCKIRFRL